MIKPRQGRKIVCEGFLSPLPGLFPFFRLTHGFTVGYFLSSLPDFAHFAFFA
jgi:hypothetical protein